jgi:hypothetical protein
MAATNHAYFSNIHKQDENMALKGFWIASYLSLFPRTGV